MSRPPEVLVIAILLILNGVAIIAAGLFVAGFIGLVSPKAGAGIYLIFLIIGLLLWIVAAGLLKTMGWAYTLAIILSAISLVNFPVGTVLGAICLWLLLKQEVKVAFRKV